MYFLLKIWVRAALQLYCGRIHVTKKVSLSRHQPIILASNHPNAFLDALIIASRVPMKVCFLAKGSAFNNRFASMLFHLLNMLPVYELHEDSNGVGKQSLLFEKCIDVLTTKGTVLVFSEGVSNNEFALRPFKKTTARLAYKAWTQDIPDLIVVPVTINYHSFSVIPKHVSLYFHKPLLRQDFEIVNQGFFYQHFNGILQNSLNEGIERPENIRANANKISKGVLALPALVGFVSQYWIYYFIKQLVIKQTRGTAYYDSVLFASLALVYPFFVFVASFLITYMSEDARWWVLLLLLPFTAWSYKIYKS